MVQLTSRLVTEVLDRLNKDIRDPALIFAIVQSLAESEKTRLPSHLRHCYGTEAGQAELRKLGFGVDDAKISEELLDYLYLTESEKGFIWKEGDPEQIKDTFELFLKRLKEKNPNAETWLARYLTVSDKYKVKPRNRRSNADIIIWEALRSIMPVDVVEIYQKAYYNHKNESGPFLMALITAYLYSAPFEKFDLNPVIQNWRLSEALNHLLSGEYTLELDDYVYDKHTAIGARRGADRSQFVTEGAVVDRQSQRYFEPVLKEIYDSLGQGTAVEAAAVDEETEDTTVEEGEE